MKKKLILVSLNARYSHVNPAPYYLKTAVRDTDFEIIIKNYTIKSDTEKIVKEITSESVEAIGFSVYIWNVNQVVI